MTDYTARNVLLKDANGNYLIPYTEKADLSLSNLNASGKAYVAIKGYDSTVTYSLNEVVMTIVSGSVLFYKSLANNNTSALSDTTKWEAVSFSGGSPAWGNITGTLSNQTDLQNVLDGKANTDLSNLTTTYIIDNSDIVAEMQIVAGTYQGRSINERFGFGTSGSAVDTFLTNRVSNHDYKGLHVGDWIDIDTGAFTLGGAGTASAGATDSDASLAATTRRFYIAGFDTYKGIGYTAITKNHIILCHLPTDFTCQWNKSKTQGSHACTNNGCSTITNPWKASKAYAVLNGVNNSGTSGGGNPTGCNALNKGVLQMLIAAGLDSSHILSRRKYGDTRYTAGSDLTDSTGGAWVDWGQIWAPSEIEVYGSQRFSTGRSGTIDFNDYGPDEWLPLFKFFGRTAGYRWNRRDYRHSSVAGGSSNDVTVVASSGISTFNATSHAQALPVCFLFGV